MSPWADVLYVSHLVGLFLGLGAASVKMVLVLMCRSDRSFLPVYLRVTKPITRQIVFGTIILVMSGIGWLLVGYEFSILLIAKIILVVGMIVLGSIIDNAVEPKLNKLAPGSTETPSPEFQGVQHQHLILELSATVLFYAIFVLGVLL